MSPGKGGRARISSPAPGGSILMTSAPMSANILPHIGPDTICANSTTTKSSSALLPKPRTSRVCRSGDYSSKIGATRNRKSRHGSGLIRLRINCLMLRGGHPVQLCSLHTLLVRTVRNGEKDIPVMRAAEKRPDPSPLSLTFCQVVVRPPDPADRVCSLPGRMFGPRDDEQVPARNRKRGGVAELHTRYLPKSDGLK